MCGRVNDSCRTSISVWWDSRKQRTQRLTIRERHGRPVRSWTSEAGSMPNRQKIVAARSAGVTGSCGEGRFDRSRPNTIPH